MESLMLISLTPPDMIPGPILINVHAIEALEPINAGARIWTRGGHTVAVTETISQVIAKINGALAEEDEQ
jgi:hypothetical protein